MRSLLCLIVSAFSVHGSFSAHSARLTKYDIVLGGLARRQHFQEICLVKSKVEEGHERAASDMDGDMELAFDLATRDNPCGIAPKSDDGDANPKLVSIAAGLLEATEAGGEAGGGGGGGEDERKLCAAREKRRVLSGASIIVFGIYGLCLIFILFMVAIPEVRFRLARRRHGAIDHLHPQKSSTCPSEQDESNIPDVPWDDSKRSTEGGGLPAHPWGIKKKEEEPSPAAKPKVQPTRAFVKKQVQPVKTYLQLKEEIQEARRRGSSR